MLKNFSLLILCCLPLTSLAQEIVELPSATNTTLQWNGDAREYFSSDWQTQVVTNVSQPSMQVFLPDAAIANGTAVVVAPGGGLFALAIEKEGNQVARWLNQKGIAAFVLKYRLLPTAEDGVNEVMKDPDAVVEKVAPVLPIAINDGINAMQMVRANADKWNIEPGKIGFMGFSAGGAVTVGVALNSSEAQAPDFIVPVYPWMTVVGDYELPEELPPMLVICAADDPLMLGPESVTLYSRWIDEGGKAGLHMYSKGGHGFGMESQGLPSDDWILRFYEWAVAEDLVSAKVPQ